MRIGQGYDVHRLITGRRLVLGGVEIKHAKGLLGHSDADVVLHAICDAVLGALGQGDIGQHFPDTDPQYKEIDSRILLQRVADRMRDQRFAIANLDAIIVAQKPKLSPYINQMRKNIAADLFAPIESINLKATTTEKLGFIGREEGIAAQVVVLLVKAD